MFEDIFDSDEANSFEANVEPYNRMGYEELVNQRYAEPLFFSKIEAQFGVIWTLIIRDGMKGFASFAISDASAYDWNANDFMAFFLAGQLYSQGVRGDVTEAWRAAKALLTASSVVVKDTADQPIGDEQESETMTSATTTAPAVIETNVAELFNAAFSADMAAGAAAQGEIDQAFRECWVFPEDSMGAGQPWELIGVVGFHGPHLPQVKYNPGVPTAERDKFIAWAKDFCTLLYDFEPAQWFPVLIPRIGMSESWYSLFFLDEDKNPQIFDVKTALAIAAAWKQAAPAYQPTVPPADQPPS